ncbi:histidine kinase [Colwellia sp. D2M02]|uniref:sensor histidine kinase n=1 Tax=Colwellia sp. D2M02 TaxID=2841562 RepID=UPI001C09F785|nr:histidine kinase [Colwellia sp. D2M02]MBU2892761.1 histidine kinase [Colwellia sp. D2M02]
MNSKIGYYLCQVIGTLLFFSFIAWAGISSHIEEGKAIDLIDELLTFIKLVTLSFLISHFVVRAYIKKHLTTKASTFKVYGAAVLCAATVGMIAHTIFGLAFGDGEKAYLAFSSLSKSFIVNGLFFTLWSLLYLGIGSIIDRARIKQQLKDHELASLMNQINPHFLFNSLNTIRGMIYEDKEKSAELVTKLSTLFRYNLSNDTKAHTSLAGELEVCQHYLAIEDIRLGDRLTLAFDISPESKNAKIPTMGLLTLVENAIKHGISNLQQGGTLVVNSRVEDNKLLVQVSNPFKKQLVKSGTQVGIKNLQQRISLIFGTEGMLTNNTDEANYTVNLTLPYEPV